MIDELLFFDKKPETLLLYEAVRDMILADFEDVKVTVQKTQMRLTGR
jgi:hypothetical protein